MAFSIHFDRDRWSRSYYPNSPSPIQDNLTFENVTVEADEIPMLLWSLTPVRQVRFINCTIKDNVLRFAHLKAEGIVYPRTELLLDGTKFDKQSPLLVHSANGTSVDLRIENSKNTDFSSAIKGDVQISKADIKLERVVEEIRY